MGKLEKKGDEAESGAGKQIPLPRNFWKMAKNTPPSPPHRHPKEVWVFLLHCQLSLAEGCSLPWRLQPASCLGCGVMVSGAVTGAHRGTPATCTGTPGAEGMQAGGSIFSTRQTGKNRHLGVRKMDVSVLTPPLSGRVTSNRSLSLPAPHFSFPFKGNNRTFLTPCERRLEEASSSIFTRPQFSPTFHSCTRPIFIEHVPHDKPCAGL